MMAPSVLGVRLLPQFQKTDGFRMVSDPIKSISLSNLSGKTWKKSPEKSLNASDPENISSLALESLNRTMEGPVPDVDFSAFCVEIPSGQMEVTTRQREVGKQLYEILTNHGDRPLICGFFWGLPRLKNT